MGINSVLYNQAGRLRSGWRFAIFFFVFTFVYSLYGELLNAIFRNQELQPASRTPVSLILISAGSLVLASVISWSCQKYLEDLPYKALGAVSTPGWLRNTIAGIAFGAGSISLAILVAIAFGGLSLRFNSEASSTAILLTLLLSLAVFIPAAAFEEVLFRGYMLQTFARSRLGWFAILITSLMFATVHNANPSSTSLSWVNTFIAGIWFGLAYMKTRDLWFPFGLHLMWNWMQGSIFGIEVSGLTDLVSAPLLNEIDAGPAWLTGGAYGIEGGVAATMALAISAVAVYILPGLKPSDEMLAMTSRENPKQSVS